MQDSKRNTGVKTEFWTLWEKARVGWFEMVVLKSVYYHMWSGSQVHGWCMRQGAQGWGTDPGEWDVEGSGRGVLDGEYMCACGWFMSVYGKKTLQYYKVISLQLNN